MMAGEYIYLHCSDGNGRSGICAAVTLALAYSLGPMEALEHLQLSRSQRHGSSGASPETHEQRMACLNELNTMLEQNALTHAIGAAFSLEHVVQAHETVEAGKTIGNVVIDIPH